MEWGGGKKGWGRELGARVRLACSEQGGLPWAVHVAGLEMRGLCLGNKALGVLGALLCSCCWVHRAETSFRGDWCLGDARQDGAVDSGGPWQRLGSRPRTCLGPHGWGGAGGCPWTRESVFSWLNGPPFPGWSWNQTLGICGVNAWHQLRDVSVWLVLGSPTILPMGSGDHRGLVCHPPSSLHPPRQHQSQAPRV